MTNQSLAAHFLRSALSFLVSADFRPGTPVGRLQGKQAATE